jgi:DNA-binding NarL/FixJ family response regulator
MGVEMNGRDEIGNEGVTPSVGIIGCYNAILADGIVKMLEGDPRFLLLGVYSYCEGFLDSIELNNIDFCIVDTFFLKCLMNGTKNNEECVTCKILLIEDTFLSKRELHSLILSSHISGILYKDTDKKKLKKALFTVLSGELWFKRDTFESLFSKTQEIIESRIIFKKLLTRAETNVVNLACQGLKNKEIAERLYISESTVKTHLNNVYKKLNISSRVQLTRLFLQEG